MAHLIVQEKPLGRFTELFPLTDGVPTMIMATLKEGEPPVSFPWHITETLPDRELAGLGIFRAVPEAPPFGKVITRYHFERSGTAVIQIIDEMQDAPAPPLDPLAVAQYANTRIDAGIEAGMNGINQLESRAHPRLNLEIPVSQEQIQELQQQINDLEETLKATLRAQMGRQPR